MIQWFKISKTKKQIQNHDAPFLSQVAHMQYKEITKKEIEQNIWTILLKNKDSVLSIKGEERSVCDECENNKNKNKKKNAFATFLICSDKEIAEKKKGYRYYKCVNEINGCKAPDNKMIIMLQQ